MLIQRLAAHVFSWRNSIGLKVLLLGALTCTTWHAKAVDDEPLFRYHGKSYTIHELPLRLRKIYQDLEQRQHEERGKLLQQMLFDVHLHQQATASGRPRGEIAKELLDPKPSTEAQVKAHFDANRDRFPGEFGAQREKIATDLRRQQLIAKRIEVSKSLLDAGNFEVLLAQPAPAPIDIPVADSAARRAIKPANNTSSANGAAAPDAVAAPIRIVEFGDYQCPRCRDAGAIISRLMHQHPGLIEWYYLDFPVNRSGVSTIIAYGGACAQAQGRFWEYHDAAFSLQGSLTNESPMQIARELELNLGVFNTCLRSNSTIQKVAASKQLGRKLGVKTTPGLFVNGRPFQTDALYDALDSLVAIKQHHAKRRKVEEIDQQLRKQN